MSGVLNDDMVNDEGGAAAQMGNLVHAACAAFHRAAASMGVKARTEEGLAAMEAARRTFPDGNVTTAQTHYLAYAGDKENQDADCAWVEQPVRLELAAADFDPTGDPVVIIGTLDQVRRSRHDGKLRLWDIKTGSRKSAQESLIHYAMQQACYLLAARQCLSDDILPGGLIYTPGYEKKLAKRFLPYPTSVEENTLLVSTVVYTVALVRMGVPLFRPGVDTCEYCAVKPYDNCLSMFRANY